MIVDNAKKSVIYYKLSDLQKRIEIDERTNDLFYGHLFPSPEILKQFKKTGQEELNGTLYDVWKCEVRESSQRKNRYIYWLSTIDGSSGRFQSWYKNDDEPWRLGSDLDEIESNVEIPDNVFDLKVPEGYMATNTLENAPQQELGQQSPGFTMLKNRVSFTLSDGSVILAWQSQGNQVHKTQDIFEQLEFGGDLPDTPIQISGLKPAGWVWNGKVTYIGYHLTSTVKNGKFIEWGLYVPDNIPPNRKQILGYDVTLKYNADDESEGTKQLMVNYGISITSLEEFNLWVLGAMAELSDDRIAPSEITYEAVAQLAKKLKSEIAH